MYEQYKSTGDSVTHPNARFRMSANVETRQDPCGSPVVDESTSDRDGAQDENRSGDVIQTLQSVLRLASALGISPITLTKAQDEGGKFHVRITKWGTFKTSVLLLAVLANVGMQTVPLLDALKSFVANLKVITRQFALFTIFLNALAVLATNLTKSGSLVELLGKWSEVEKLCAGMRRELRKSSDPRRRARKGVLVFYGVMALPNILVIVVSTSSSMRHGYFREGDLDLNVTEV